MTTPILGLDEIVQSQASKYLTHNEALRAFEAKTVRVLSDSTTAQPVSPSEGDSYIIPASATGADWSTYAQNDIAWYMSGAWHNYTPVEGVSVWVNDLDTNKTFDSTSWVSTGGGISNLVEDTTPQLGGQLDVNGNAIGDGTLELLTFSETASAVNHVNITNAATGNGPQVSAAGDDTDIDLSLQPKGTGDVLIGNYTLDGDQTVGAGQDNYVLTYDNATGLISLEASAGGSSLPVPDTTSIVEGSADATKEVRFEVDGLTTGTTRVITMPDEDVTLSNNGLLVAEHEVTGSAVTSVQFTGLDLNADNSYRIEFEIINGTASTVTLYAYVNGDTTATNYYSQEGNTSGGTSNAGRSNHAGVLNMVASQEVSCKTLLQRANGYPTFLSQFIKGRSSSIEEARIVQKKTATVTNVTQLDFTADVSSGIGVGSKIRIYRG